MLKESEMARLEKPVSRIHLVFKISDDVVVVVVYVLFHSFTTILTPSMSLG